MSINSCNPEQLILLKYLVMNLYCKGCFLGYWRIRGMSFTNDGQEEVSQGEKLFQKCEDEISEYEKVCQKMNKRVPQCVFFLRLCLSTLLHWMPTLKVEAMMTMITMSKLKTLALIRAWSDASNIGGGICINALACVAIPVRPHSLVSLAS